MADNWIADWQEPEPALIPDDYLAEAPFLIRQTLWRRGYHDERSLRAFLAPLAYQMPEEPFAPALEAAVTRVLRARDAGERVAVWGDYDADGQCAAALLVAALAALSVEVQSFHLRSDERRRGLTPSGIAATLADGCRLLITCDFGTNDTEAVACARQYGLDVIITDHHIQMGERPAALSLLNSSSLPPGDPCSGLSGAGVAFVLARGVLRAAGKGLVANGLLDLVAIGSIADLAPNTELYRALLARGTRLLWKQPRPGIAALLEFSSRRPSGVDTSGISFLIGPALNATGRLGTPADGVSLLLERDPGRARELAAGAQALREERNRLAAALIGDAVAQFETRGMDGVFLARGRNWHPAVLGRACSELSRRYRRPVVLISERDDGGPIRGSARADGGLDLTRLLQALEDQLEAFGGHPNAAGFTVKPECVDSLCARLSVELARGTSEQPGARVRIDAAEDWSDFDGPRPGSVPLVQWLLRLGPHCEGNEEPLAAHNGVSIGALRPFGPTGQHYRVTLDDGRGHSRVVKWWNGMPSLIPSGLVDVAYTVALDDWQGSTSIQYILRGMRPHQQSIQDSR